MDNNKFDFLIPEVSKKITNKFLDILSEYPEFIKEEIDTSPLLNFSMGVFISSLSQILDMIKKNTQGEEKLISNIELAENGLLDFFKKLPFIIKVESF